MTPDTIATYEAYAHLVSKTSLADHFRHIVIDSRPNPKRFDHHADAWQRDLLAELIPAMEYAAGLRTEYHGPRCFFVVMPRGHSKTSTIAQLLNWCLCYAHSEVKAYAAAADEEQAGILLERMKAEAKCNPWVKVTVGNKQASGATGTLEVLSSDAPSSSGKLADVIVVDELAWHKKRDLFDVLYSGRTKRPNCCFIILSNAGIKGTWQHDIYRNAQSDPGWKVWEVPAFSATWLNRADIESDRNILLPSIFKRVHLNIWVDENEENAFVTRQQVEGCIGDCPEGSQHVVAVDYGAVHDRTALAVMHPDKDRVILDRLEVWQGDHAHRVPIERVEEWVSSMSQQFRIRKLLVDAWQLEGSCQKWEKFLPLERYSFGGSGHHIAAENLRTLIVNGRLRIYPGAGSLTLADGTREDLVDELSSLIVVEQGSTGKYRFDHLPGKHDDRCFVAGTMISTARGEVPIEEITTDDLVLTRSGYRRVLCAGCTGEMETVTIRTSNGHTLTGTKEHPIMTERGWQPIGKIQEDETSFCRHEEQPGIVRNGAAVKSIIGGAVREVYNLSVEGAEEYFANGFLAHNCCVLALAALGCVQMIGKANIHTVLDTMIQVKKEETDMIGETSYAEIHYIKGYGTWQIRPLIRGVATPLTDYRTQAEAAYAVNAVHRLLGTRIPNSIVNAPEEKRCKEIENEVKNRLEARKYLPLPDKTKPKKKEEKTNG